MKRLAIALAVVSILGSTNPVFAEELPAMTVWKTPSCGCCGNWVKHMRAAGFEVQVENVDDLGPVKRLAAVPEKLQSCHTARVGRYTVEGHVPASDILRLLKERPNAVGLAVPGMPSGSPGMENGDHDPYEVLMLKRDGETAVFSSYR